MVQEGSNLLTVELIERLPTPYIQFREERLSNGFLRWELLLLWAFFKK